jgi:hypothetical protein
MRAVGIPEEQGGGVQLFFLTTAMRASLEVLLPAAALYA